MTKEEIYIQKREEANNAYDEWKEEMTGHVKKKYEGHYIKWKDNVYDENIEYRYMFVKSVFLYRDDGRFKIDFVGRYMDYCFDGYDDDTYVDWDVERYYEFFIDDFDDNAEYRDNQMIIIDEDEWAEAFDTMMKKTTEYELKKRNKINNL